MARAAKQPSWGSPWRAANDESSPRPVSSSSVVATCCGRTFLSDDFLAKHVARPGPCKAVTIVAPDNLLESRAARGQGTKLRYQALAERIETAIRSGQVRSLTELRMSGIVAEYRPVVLNAALELLEYDGLVLPEKDSTKCSEKDCHEDQKVRGLCMRHYRQESRKGGFTQKRARRLEAPQHATEAGYRWHLYQSQQSEEWAAPACDACKTAHRTYNAANRTANPTEPGTSDPSRHLP